MSHYAQVINGIVQQVIVADQEVINSNLFGPASEWIQTSYNTRGGVHYAPNSNTPDGGIALRGNYAGIGYTYDATHDVFYAPQPFPSWTLNQSTWLWEAPIPMPTSGGPYKWDETTKTWVVLP